MKKILPAISIVLVSITGYAQSQLTAFDTENTQFFWNENGFDVLPTEVGSGSIDSCIFNIEVEANFAHYKIEYWFNSFTTSTNSNADSLELRSDFECPENIVYHHIQMRMNDSIREGRVIKRANAINIWNNAVYDPVYNQDPGLITKDGETCHLRLYPVGNTSSFHAYVTLSAVQVLDRDSIGHLKLVLPTSLLETSTNPISSIKANLSLSTEFSGIENGSVWQNAGSNQFTFDGNINQIQNETFTIYRTIPNAIEEVIYQDSLNYYSITNLSESIKNHTSSTDYIILLDVDKSAWYNNNEGFQNALEESFNNVVSRFKESDRFKVITKGTFFESLSDSWLSANSTELASAKEFIANPENHTTNPQDALAYVKNFIESDNNHLIFITTHKYYDYINLSEKLNQFANQLNLQCRTDFLSLFPSTNYTSSTDLSLYKSIIKQSRGGYIANNFNLDSKKYFALPLIIEIESSAENASDIFISRIDNQDYLYQNKTSLSSANQYLLKFSNGDSLFVDNQNTAQVIIGNSIQSFFGSAKISSELNSLSEQFGNSFLANQSVNFQCLTDYSALLVVENDSQYLDTTSNIIVFFPLETEDIETETFRLFPNPTHGILNVTSNSNNVIAEIRILDLSGKMVKNFGNINQPETLIDLSELKPSIYIVEILESEGAISRHKIQVIH